MKKRRHAPPEPLVWYQLHCVNCSSTLDTIAATTEAELVYPSYDQAAREMSYDAARRLEGFHAIHRGHRLVGITEDSAE